MVLFGINCPRSHVLQALDDVHLYKEQIYKESFALIYI